MYNYIVHLGFMLFSLTNDLVDLERSRPSHWARYFTSKRGGSFHLNLFLVIENINDGQSVSFHWSVLSTTQLHRDHPYITSSRYEQLTMCYCFFVFLILSSTCSSLQYTSNIYFTERYVQQAGAELCQAQEKLGLAKSDLSRKKLWLSSI